MSRVGKKPIPIPAGVTITAKGRDIAVKGPKGELTFSRPEEVEVRQEGAELLAVPLKEDPATRAKWGMTRAILANHILGVTKGFEKNLELTGVGYRAAMQGAKLQLQLGYSHDIVYNPPAGIKIESGKPTEIKISGIDKQQVGQVAAEIRSYRPPEPYKGKGVRVAGEFVRRKEGKKK